MNRLIVAAAGVVLLAGCNRPWAGGAGTGPHGRYSGVGVYPAGRMWRQMVGGADSQDPKSAKLDDDEQVIVVVDGATGELRECGNLSGYCVGLSPWAKLLPGSQTAPLSLGKHAPQLADEAAARAKAASAPKP